MRKKRHPLQYEAQFYESHKEVENSINRADKLVKLIETHIDMKPSPKRLF
jgi:hypothetical protein